MKTIRFLVSVFLFVAVIGILLPSARADEWNKRTKLTFHEPVQIGSTVLQPGKYWFKLHDSQGFRNIVVITTEAGDVVATVISIPKYRATLDDHTKIQFWETPRGTPVAIRSWFYPAENLGHEFPSPPQAAERLAAEVYPPVPDAR